MTEEDEEAVLTAVQFEFPQPFSVVNARNAASYLLKHPRILEVGVAASSDKRALQVQAAVLKGPDGDRADILFGIVACMVAFTGIDRDNFKPGISAN
jgi:hypothetical protein